MGLLCHGLLLDGVGWCLPPLEQANTSACLSPSLAGVSLSHHPTPDRAPLRREVAVAPQKSGGCSEAAVHAVCVAGGFRFVSRGQEQNRNPQARSPPGSRGGALRAEFPPRWRPGDAANRLHGVGRAGQGIGDRVPGARLGEQSAPDVDDAVQPACNHDTLTPTLFGQ